MMSRASRMLKWPVAATVLLAAAPIAYAEPSTASTRPSAPADSARCGGGSRGFAGFPTIAGPADTGFGFEPAAVGVQGSAASVWPGATGTSRAGDGAIGWTAGGTPYTAGPAGVMCTGPAAHAQVTGKEPNPGKRP